MKLSELKNKKLTLLQTGQSGHGKTSRTLTATRFGKVYIFDFDGKIQGAVRKLPAAYESTMPTNWTDLIEIDNFQEKTFDEALKKLKELSAQKDKLSYATIVIDTYTALNDKVYEKIMGEKLAAGKKAERDEWGMINSALTYFFNILLALPANIIVNCHVSETEDEVTKRTKYGQAGKGGHRYDLSAKFSDSHYIYFADGKYNIRLKNSDTFPVNTCLPDKFIDKNGLAVLNDLSIFDDYAIVRK